jgi:hypothetical protein
MAPRPVEVLRRSLMPTHRFHYEFDPTKGGTWFSDRGVRICDWSWDAEKKMLRVRRGLHSEEVSLSGVDALEPQEFGRRLSAAALEAAQRSTSHR